MRVTVHGGVPGSLVGVQGQPDLGRLDGRWPVHAYDLVREFPTVELDSPALDAARLLAEHNLPGLIVLDDRRQPAAVLASTDVLGLVLPGYVRESAASARVVDEAHADLFCTRVGARTVRECLLTRADELPVVGVDANLLEIAGLMTRTGCPLVAVVDQAAELLGAVTLDSLLLRALAC